MAAAFIQHLGWSVLTLPALVGLLSAGQTAYGKVGSDFLNLLTGNNWGRGYLLSRMVIPCGAYVAWYFSQTPSVHSFPMALACGLGAEALLRAKFYVGTDKAGGPKTEDIYRGLFDLVEWYQSLCLRKAGIASADSRKEIVERVFRGREDFVRLCADLRLRVDSLPTDVAAEVSGKIDEAVSRFTATAPPSAEAHRRAIFQLGYALLIILGESALTDFSEP